MDGHLGGIVANIAILSLTPRSVPIGALLSAADLARTDASLQPNH